MKSTVDTSATVRPNPTVLVSLCSAISSVQSSYVGTQIKDRMHTGARCCIPFNEFTADSPSYRWIDIIGYSFASSRFVPLAANTLDMMKTYRNIRCSVSFVPLRAMWSDSNAYNRGRYCRKIFARQAQIKNSARCIANTLHVHSNSFISSQTLDNIEIPSTTLYE